MKPNLSEHSLDLVKMISNKIDNQTFHHHYHVLYDIARTIIGPVNYVEIGCYAGGSACLMLQRPMTHVVSIDLGTPIKPDVVKKNVALLNTHGNKFHYIQGNSQLTDTVATLQEHISQIDILFIDGDHSKKGVTNDFGLYEPLVKPGGWIVFDDYLDIKHSPQVRIAVDELMKSVGHRFDIIGTVPNQFGARPATLKHSNVFIIKKM